MVTAYTRPAIDSPVFRDEAGQVIDYGNRWDGSRLTIRPAAATRATRRGRAWLTNWSRTFLPWSPVVIERVSEQGQAPGWNMR